MPFTRSTAPKKGIYFIGAAIVTPYPAVHPGQGYCIGEMRINCGIISRLPGTLLQEWQQFAIFAWPFTRSTAPHNFMDFIGAAIGIPYPAIHPG
jgi:hypothetical protein